MGEIFVTGPQAEEALQYLTCNDVSKLTDQDILSMAETEYMNQTQLEYFRNRLLEAEQEETEFLNSHQHQVVSEFICLGRYVGKY